MNKPIIEHDEYIPSIDKLFLELSLFTKATTHKERFLAEKNRILTLKNEELKRKLKAKRKK